MPPGSTKLGAWFRRMWAAAAVSNLGDGLGAVALPLLAERLTKQAVLISGIVAMRYSAWFLFGLVGGAIADRTDRRRLMVAVDLARTVVIAIVGIGVVGGNPPIALLWAGAFLLGCGEVFFDSASEAILPNVVAHVDGLERANGLLFTTQSVANEMLGPSIGALCFAVSTSLPFFLDAWSFLAAALIMMTLRGSFRPSGHTEPAAPTTSLHEEIREGFRFVRDHRLIRSITLIGCAWNFFAIGALSTNVLFAKRLLHVSDGEFGLILSTFAFGSVIAGLLVDRITARFGSGRSLLATLLVGGISGLVAATATNAYTFAIVYAVGFTAGTAASIVVLSLRQQLVPDALRGRVSAFFRTAIFASGALGTIVLGTLAQTVSYRAPSVAFGVAGLALFVGSLPEVNERTVAAARAEAR